MVSFSSSGYLTVLRERLITIHPDFADFEVKNWCSTLASRNDWNEPVLPLTLPTIRRQPYQLRSKEGLIHYRFHAGTSQIPCV